MFTGELAESRQTEVTIREVDEAAMEILIDFCYTSHIVVEESNVQTLLPAACLLQLAEIQEVCCEFLKRQLDPSNCLGKMLKNMLGGPWLVKEATFLCDILLGASKLLATT